MDYYIPKETEAILVKRANECRNLSLLLDKYPRKIAVDDSKGKGLWLSEVATIDHIDSKLAENAYLRWLAMTRAVEAQHFKATLNWRMVIGLGGESVLETDLTLHHLYGIPYIPGSALKGLARAYAAGEEKQFYLAKEGSDSESTPSISIDSDHPDIKRIFGSQEQAGTVVFFDAMPVNIDGKTAFELDIMNPHYPDYYRTQQSSHPSAPTNDQSPNPVNFLTVAKTTFAFALAPRNSKDPKHHKDVEIISEILQTALEKYGVGGKTSAGYGYFKKIQDEQELASAGQQLTQTKVSPPVEPISIPVAYVRPPIPNFRVSQDITGSVVVATDDLRRRTPSDTKAFLRYQSFALKDVVIIVNTEEAENWKPGETRICQFVREEEVEGYTVLVCHPRPSKKKKG